MSLSRSCSWRQLTNSYKASNWPLRSYSFWKYTADLCACFWNSVHFWITNVWIKWKKSAWKERRRIDSRFKKKNAKRVPNREQEEMYNLHMTGLTNYLIKTWFSRSMSHQFTAHSLFSEGTGCWFVVYLLLASANKTIIKFSCIHISSNSYRVFIFLFSDTDVCVYVYF